MLNYHLTINRDQIEVIMRALRQRLAQINKAEEYLIGFEMLDGMGAEKMYTAERRETVSVLQLLRETIAAKVDTITSGADYE